MAFDIFEFIEFCMSIIKAFLVSLLLLISIEVVGIILSTTILFIPSHYLIHILGLSRIITNLICFSIVTIYLFKTSQYRPKCKVEFRNFNYQMVIPLLALALGRYLLCIPFFEGDNLSQLHLNNSINSSFFTIFYKCLATLILAPIFEELIFRYYIYNGLTQRYSIFTAILVSTLMFSLIHVFNIKSIFPSLIFGAISCYIYYKTNNLLYSILLHFFSNVIAISKQIFKSEYYQILDSIHYGILLLFTMIVGICTCIIAIKLILMIQNKSSKTKLLQ